LSAAKAAFATSTSCSIFAPPAGDRADHFAADSVVVFVTLSGSDRYAFVGDLVWQLEGFLEREERPWFEARTLGENPVLLRQSLLRMSAIATRYPHITIVPSHDPRGYASIPEWLRSATR
jgi:hypothetical protein